MDISNWEKQIPVMVEAFRERLREREEELDGSNTMYVMMCVEEICRAMEDSGFLMSPDDRTRIHELVARAFLYAEEPECTSAWYKPLDTH